MAYSTMAEIPDDDGYQHDMWCCRRCRHGINTRYARRAYHKKVRRQAKRDALNRALA